MTLHMAWAAHRQQRFSMQLLPPLCYAMHLACLVQHPVPELSDNMSEPIGGLPASSVLAPHVLGAFSRSSH